MSYGACPCYSKNKALNRCILSVELLFFASYGHILGLVSSSVQEMPTACVSFRGEYWVSIPTHVCLYRVTSHVKAMEDAVEIGLRAAFNEAGFNSFSKVLPGLKLRGKHLLTSHGTKLIAYMHYSQPGNRLRRITLLISSMSSSKRLLSGIMCMIARI